MVLLLRRTIVELDTVARACIRFQLYSSFDMGCPVALANVAAQVSAGGFDHNYCGSRDAPFQ